MSKSILQHDNDISESFKLITNYGTNREYSQQLRITTGTSICHMNLYEDDCITADLLLQWSIRLRQIENKVKYNDK